MTKQACAQDCYCDHSEKKKNYDISVWAYVVYSVNFGTASLMRL